MAIQKVKRIKHSDYVYDLQIDEKPHELRECFGSHLVEVSKDRSETTQGCWNIPTVTASCDDEIDPRFIRKKNHDWFGDNNQ